MSVWRCDSIERNAFDVATDTDTYTLERITGEPLGQERLIAGTTGLFTVGEFYDDDLNHLPNWRRPQ